MRGFHTACSATWTAACLGFGAVRERGSPDARARHTARVTALLPRGRGGVQCTHFASSAADGVVMLWRLREAVPIACFSEHVGAIRALLQPGPAHRCAGRRRGAEPRLARTRLARRVPIRGRAAHRPQLVQSRTWHPRTTLPRTVLTRAARLQARQASSCVSLGTDGTLAVR